MKKDGFALVFIIIILCAAAGAATIGALAEPSGSGGGVTAPFASGSEEKSGNDDDGTRALIRSCFVDASQYSSMLLFKRRQDFEPSAISFEKISVPYDTSVNTVYIPQSCDTADWTGFLYAKEPYSKICILDDGGAGKAESLKEGTSFKMAVVSPNTYMECDLVFTGLPVVCMDNEEGKIESGEEYTGTFRVLDPYRDEYQSAACTCHIRGATSVIFDKKSYRVELMETASGSDKKSFLGLRKDDDWILNSICTDRSLAREKICYDLWKRLNEMEEQPVPSSEMEYCELFVNDEYMGVYGLMYPVDRKLMGMAPGDLLYKVGTWYEEISFEGKLTDYNGKTEILNKNGVSYLELKYPKEEGKDCIYDPFALYQAMVFETGDMSALTDAGITLNMDNFILHELFCEMTRAGDNTWKNMFIAAYSDGKGGYSFSETIWDLNYTFGDSYKWDPDNGNTIFSLDTVNNYKLRYDRDYGYAALVHHIDGIREDTAEKWNKWRSEGIGPEYISSLFEEEKEYLIRSGAFSRNADRWNLEDQETDFDKIEDWITGRFEFLDEMYGFNS